ncbi:MAG: hypothetical protein NTZ34_02515 [Chloroflexi bacterium]|nr:hypothetical protein [Chloroflexota bacterium]
MVKNEETRIKRFRNHPTMKEIVREFLKKKKGAVTLEELTDHVLKNVKLVSKTPRNSVFSVLKRMDDVERVSQATYKIKGK